MPDEPLTAELVLLYAWPVLNDQQPVRTLLAKVRGQVDQLVDDEPALALDEPELTIVERAQLPPRLAAARPDTPDNWDLAVIARVRALRLPAPTDKAARRAHLARLAISYLTDQLGWPASRIAELLGFTANYVSSIRGGLRGTPNPRPPAHQHDDTVQALTGQGWTDRRIAEHLGLSARSIGRIRARLDLPPVRRPRSDAAQLHRDTVQALAAQGYENVRIAEQVGISREHVRRILVELRGVASTDQPRNDTPTGDHQVVTGGKP